jgi:predicted secreted protein
MVIKGQNLRIFVGNRVLAMALSCDVNVQSILKNITNKDTVGEWTENKVTALNWNVKAQVVVCDDVDYGVTVDELKDMVGTAVQIDFATAEGTHNADKGDPIVSGWAILSDVNITAEKRKRSLCDIQLTGKGRLIIPLILADVNGVVLRTADGYCLAVG